ncbi:Uncharacterised protein [uncultured archaeon]|nr:Uncharacterised protein [uncultured archaeon]
MSTVSETYSALNRAWASTSKIIFGEPLGELKEYGPWLSDSLELPHERRSSISGEAVALSINDYAPTAKYAALGELDYGKSYAPMSLNQIKDIDSILEAVSERFYYAGNIILGKSTGVERSTDVIDSHFIYECSLMDASKYCAYSRYLNNSEYCFGLYGTIKSSTSIKCSGSKFTRCLECHSSEIVTDCYYCGSMQNSSDCLFSFGGRGKSFLIGNLQLPKARYFALKSKLVAEMAGELKKKRKLYSLFSILQACRPYKPEIQIRTKWSEPKFNMAPIQQAFSDTSRLLLGQDLGQLEDYAGWLYSHVPANVPLRSPFSGREALIAGYRKIIGDIYHLDGRLLPDDEVQRVADFAIEEKDAAGLDASNLDSVCRSIHKVAYSDLDKVVGHNVNVKGSAVTIDAQDSYMGSANIRCKKCAYSFWPDNSENIFGSYVTWESAFCMKCSNSRKLQRCFEVSDSHQCSDCYFSHNIENCSECMFCFNVKAKRFAIGNVEYPKEEFLKIKKLVLAELASKLEKHKTLGLSIYNIGAKK